QHATLFSVGTAEVAGEPARVSPTSDWKPLKIRAVALSVAAGLFLVVLAVVVGAYNHQSAWHASVGHGSLVGQLGFGSVVAALALAGVLTLPKRTWRSLWAYIPGGVL